MKFGSLLEPVVRFAPAVLLLVAFFAETLPIFTIPCVQFAWSLRLTGLDFATAPFGLRRLSPRRGSCSASGATARCQRARTSNARQRRGALESISPAWACRRLAACARSTPSAPSRPTWLTSQGACNHAALRGRLRAGGAGDRGGLGDPRDAGQAAIDARACACPVAAAVAARRRRELHAGVLLVCRCRYRMLAVGASACAVQASYCAGVRDRARRHQRCGSARDGPSCV